MSYEISEQDRRESDSNVQLALFCKIWYGCNYDLLNPKKQLEYQNTWNNFPKESKVIFEKYFKDKNIEDDTSVKTKRTKPGRKDHSSDKKINSYPLANQDQTDEHLDNIIKKLDYSLKISASAHLADRNCWDHYQKKLK